MSLARSFSTTRYPHAERVQVWSEHIKGSLFDAAIQPFSAAGLDAESHVRRSGEISVFAFRSNEHAVQRTPEAIAATPKRALFVSAILTGSAVLYQPGVVHVATPGDVLVYSPDVPYLIAFQPNTSQLFTEMPPEVFAGRYGTDATGQARKTNISRSRTAGLTVADLQRLARDVASQSIGDGDIDRRIDALLALVSESAFPTRLPATLYTAKSFIDDNADDPDVTPAVIAARVHLSPRQLNRLFAMEGTTVAGYLAAVRTATAERLLTETTLSLSDVAALSGFGSVSTLSRHARRPATTAMS